MQFLIFTTSRIFSFFLRRMDASPCVPPTARWSVAWTWPPSRSAVASAARHDGGRALSPDPDAASCPWRRLCAAVAGASLSGARPCRGLRPSAAPRRVPAASPPRHRPAPSAPQGGGGHDRRREAGLHCSWHFPRLWHPLCGAGGSRFWGRRARPAWGARHPHGAQDPTGAAQGPRLYGVVRWPLLCVWHCLLRCGLLFFFFAALWDACVTRVQATASSCERLSFAVTRGVWVAQRRSAAPKCLHSCCWHGGRDPVLWCLGSTSFSDTRVATGRLLLSSRRRCSSASRCCRWASSACMFWEPFVLPVCCGIRRYMPAGGPDSHFQSDKRMRWKAKQDAMREAVKKTPKKEA